MGIIPTPIGQATTIGLVKAATITVTGTLRRALDIVTPTAETITALTTAHGPIIMTSKFTFGSNSK